jgi:hypothetical protein
MLSIEESIRKVNMDKLRDENDRKTRQNKSQETELLLEFLAKSFEEFIRQLGSGKYSVDVKFPDIQQVRGDVSVEGLSTLLHALNELKVATKGNKLTLPETQKISGEVTVKNPTPETKIPDYPKQIKSEVVSLPKYVGEKLDSIKTELSKIEVKPEVNVETKASDVNIDLSGVKDKLESVIDAIEKIEIPENKIDLSDVISACKETTEAINNLIFPVPNFHSSYDHSLSMRSEDMDKTFAYTTDGTAKVIESITVRDVDGGQYIKTYTYSGDGSGDPATESKWERI